MHYLIEHWRDQGVAQLIFLLHHQADLITGYIESKVRAGAYAPCQLRTLTEPTPLGTGGAIAFAVRQLGLTGSFLVSNADTWLGTGVDAVSGTPPAAMAVVEVANAERYGSVVTKGTKVIEFKEKKVSAGHGWVNAGLYHLDSEMFDHWDGAPFSLETNLFPRLASSERLHTVPLSTDFIDIGIPEDYFRFCRWVESGKAGTL